MKVIGNINLGNQQATFFADEDKYYYDLYKNGEPLETKGGFEDLRKMFDNMLEKMRLK